MSFWRKSPFYRCRSDPNAIIFIQDDIINIFLFFPIGHKSTQSIAIQVIGIQVSGFYSMKHKLYCIWEKIYEVVRHHGSNEGGPANDVVNNIE